MTTLPTRTLNDGTTVPAIGFGTYPLTGEDGIRAMVSAIEAGNRLLDTAVNYKNEAEVGEAVRRSGLDRDDLVIQTKIPGRDHAYDKAVSSVEGSLERLGLDHVDVGLIHWPNPSQHLYVETYRALVECQRRGLVRSVGVSNFNEQHLADVIDATGVVPVVNQIELHPLFPQEGMREVHDRLGVVTEAWSPLGKRNAPFGADPVEQAAAAHEVTPGQVILRWHVQLGVLPLPKSADPDRQRANLELFDFELTDDEVTAISGLAQEDGRLFGGDPDTHEEM